jgi:phosphoribosylamine--glycine ligase
VVKGALIPDIPVSDDEHTYYAGVSNSHVGLVAASGRVLLVEATRSTLQEARDAVYGLIEDLPTEGMFYRHDIGAKALKQ